MKKLLILITTICLTAPAVVSAADQIRLRDEKTGKEYGPVETSNGARITIGENTLLVETVEYTPAQEELLERLKSTVIPSLTLDRSLVADAAAFLRQSAKEIDPESEWINILTMFGDKPDNSVTLSLELNNISLHDALRYCCEATGMRMRIDENAVVLSF